MTTPTSFPSSPQTGAALSSIGSSLPSLAMSSVWLARPRTSPVSMTFLTGCSAGFRVSSLTMRKTSSRRFPRASAADHPVSDSATGFM